MPCSRSCFGAFASPDGRLTRTSDVRLARAGAGDYELVLSIIDDVTGQTLRVQEEFTLVAPRSSR